MAIVPILEMQNHAEVIARLGEFERKVRMKLIDAALKASGELLCKETAARSPVKSGLLKKSLVVRFGRRTRNGRTVRVEFSKTASRVDPLKKGLASVSKAGRRAFYPFAVEFGHAAPGQAGGPKIVPPQPFMRPAFEAKKQEAITAFATSLANGIENRGS